MMTEIEAIEKIKKQICNEKGVQRYCRDNCMHGTEYCAYSMAIKALEKQIKLKECIEKLKIQDFECFETDRNGMIEVLNVFLLDWE